jgi:serine/threonine protein kinase
MEKSAIFEELGARYPLALPSGFVLHDKYTMGRVLGVGGFGITYLGWDDKLNIPVAMKEFLPSGSAARGADAKTLHPNSPQEFRFGMDRFLQEAQTLAQLNHYNIVRVRDFFEENGTAYFVMDFYDGKTLDEYMKEQGGKLPESTVSNIFIPILDGLREAHYKNILHRDIKPANIYLARLESGGVRPILLDFGAARFAIGSRSKSISMIVTPGYAPYEQYQTRGEQGTWTDVYGVAATMYHAITGIVPPPAPDRMVDDDIVPPSQFGASQKFNNILMNALALRPANRVQDAAALQDLLLGENAPPFAEGRASNLNMGAVNPLNAGGSATRRISESLPPSALPVVPPPQTSGAQQQAWGQTSGAQQQAWNQPSGATSGVASDVPVQKSNGWIWGVLAVIAVVVSGAAYLVMNPSNGLLKGLMGGGNAVQSYQSYVREGDSLYVLQKYDEALHSYQSALEQDSSSTVVKERKKDLEKYVDWMAQGNAKHADNWYAKAIEYFKKAKGVIPEAREPDQKINASQSRMAEVIAQAKNFPEQYVSALNSGDPSQLYNFYNDTVDYLGKGTKSRQDVKTDIEQAVAKYSEYHYDINSPVGVEASANEPQRYKVFYDMTFSGTGATTGNAINFIVQQRFTLWWKGDHFVITYERGKVLEKKTTPSDHSIFDSLQLDTTNVEKPSKRFDF